MPENSPGYTEYSVKLIALFISIAAMVALAPPAIAKTSLENQREDFRAARHAVRKGAISTFRKHRKRLDNYVLKGYLDYEYLRRQLHKPQVKQYQAFFAEYKDSPVSSRLRAKWLVKLAKQGRWQLFLDNYKDLGSTRLACYQALALQKTGQNQAANRAAEKLWLVGKSQPRSCDKVFANWRASGAATPKLIWARIKLAMHKRRPNLAKYLARFLGPSERKWVERWRRMYRQPAKMLAHKHFRSDTPLVREIVLHGVERLARIDAAEAAKRWKAIQGRYSFTDKARNKTLRRIAISAATQRIPEALPLLKKVNARADDLTVQDWRVRSSLISNNWSSVLDSIASLPQSRKNENNWQYWRARALGELGYTQQSETIYSRLAKHFSYQSLMAADRLSIPYALDGNPLNANKDELERLRNIPGIARAEELYKIGMTIDGRREWQRAIKTMKPRQLQLAAVLASKLGWHDRAVLTIGRTKTLDDLKLRYPIVFEKKVLRHAKRNRIEPAWVYGVLRQESAYMTDARSHAGALGLMQLMPGTARLEARALRLRLRNQHEILNVDKNIRLGTAHLKRVLNINKGHKVLATASYNAGAQRVKSWLPESASMPADIWIETIPFKETRKYVKKVLSTTSIFEKHLGQPVTSISLRMSKIIPKP